MAGNFLYTFFRRRTLLFIRKREIPEMPDNVIYSFNEIRGRRFRFLELPLPKCVFVERNKITRFNNDIH